MPNNEYSTPSHGSLKIKGVSKPLKKKKKKRERSEEEKAAILSEATGSEGPTQQVTEKPRVEIQSGGGSGANVSDDRDFVREGGEYEDEEEGGRRYKTEAELRHEETRRKRLDERLKREGLKTHKERVEELNRYLSGLSEHHDMPRIGPG